MMKIIHAFEEYLEESEYINFSDSEIKKLALELKENASDEVELIRNTYHFVRDEIPHSWDIQSHIVTAKASDVLKYKTGICWAKSNLLAALLRANRIPCGIGYQKLTLGDTADTGFCIHSLNAIYVKSIDKWVRVDARGNKPGIDAQFHLDKEQLAFAIREEIGEVDFGEIYARPALKLMNVLDSNEDAIEMYANHLPDTL